VAPTTVAPTTLAPTAADLTSGGTSDTNTTGYAAATAALKNPMSLPDAQQTPAQNAQYHADIDSLNAFFNTPRLHKLTAHTHTHISTSGTVWSRMEGRALGLHNGRHDGLRRGFNPSRSYSRPKGSRGRGRLGWRRRRSGAAG
jgi:hypothetical protein